MYIHMSIHVFSEARLHGAIEVHLHNMMIDLDWLITECPALLSVPRVMLFFGRKELLDSNALAADRASANPRFVLFDPPKEPYGLYSYGLYSYGLYSYGPI